MHFTTAEWVHTPHLSVEYVAPGVDVDGSAPATHALLLATSGNTTGAVLTGTPQELRVACRRMLAALDGGPTPPSRCGECGDPIPTGQPHPLCGDCRDLVAVAVELDQWGL